LNFNVLHGLIPKKIELFITTGVRTSSPTYPNTVVLATSRSPKLFIYLFYVAGYSLYDKGRSDEIRSQPGIGDWARKYTKGKKKNWLSIFRGCHQKELQMARRLDV
jgi:hypothetical protein